GERGRRAGLYPAGRRRGHSGAGRGGGAAHTGEAMAERPMVDAGPGGAGARLHYGWIVLGTMTVLLLAASGVRSSFGVFIKPMEAEFGWDRTSMSVVAAMSLFFYGAVGPFVGRLADRFGPRGILAASAVLIGAGTLGTATVVTLWQLYLTAGTLTAIGAGGVSMSVAAAVAARWFDARRGLVRGIAGGGRPAADRAPGDGLDGVVGLAPDLRHPRRGLHPRDRAAGPGADPQRPAGARARPVRRRPGAAPKTVAEIAGERTGFGQAARTLPFWL